MTLETHPLFTVHIVWHPSFENGLQIAKHIRSHFRRGIYKTTGKNLDVSVLYHNAPSPDASVPLPVDWSKPGFTAAVVLIEPALTDDPAWREYIENMVADYRVGGTTGGFFPVIIKRNGNDFRLNEQALQWDLWDMPEKERRLRLALDLTSEFCCIIRNHLEELHLGEELPIDQRLEKIQVFISHSKHDRDGEVVANGIRDWLHKNSQLSSFMDVHDIPPGESFQNVLLNKLDAGAFIAIHTDSYSSHEWCRREVIETKRRMVPMIVVDCVQELDPRSIPYLGNVPVARMEPDQKNRATTIIGYLLDEIFRTWLWRYRVEPHQTKFPGVRFTAWPPELITLATLPNSLDQGVTALVYPEPLLGVDEGQLFSEIAPSVNVQTLAQWLEEHP